MREKYGDYPPDKTHEGRYVTGGQSHMVSVAGTGYNRRPHYPVKRPRRLLPTTTGAPFRVDETGSDSAFGVGQQHISERGFQQAKVNKRGNIRDRTSADAVGGIAPDSIKDQLKTIEQELAELKRGHKTQTSTIREVKGKFNEVSSETVSALSNPQHFVSGHMLQIIGKAGPHGAAIAAAITAAISVPVLAEKIIKILSQKGLPLNADWHRLVEEEVNALFDIESKSAVCWVKTPLL